MKKTSTNKIKTTTKIWIIYLILAAHWSISYANPPLTTDHLEKLGRVTLFKNDIVKGDLEYQYYLPTAFRSELECTPQGSQKARCLLRVFNELSESEIQLIQGSGPTNAISDLSYNILDKIEEKLEVKQDIIDPSSVKTIYTRTLRLSEAPYVMTSFIIDRQDQGQLLHMYKNEGLGIFKGVIHLKASQTTYYLSIKKTEDLQEQLSTLGNKKMKVTEIKNEIKNAIKDLAVQSKGFNHPNELLIEILQKKFFKKTFGGKLQLKLNDLKQLPPGELILLDDTTYDHPYVCSVTLELKEDSQPQTVCQWKGL